MPIYLKSSRVGTDENLLYFLSKWRLQLQGRHKKSGSVGLTETQIFVFRPNHLQPGQFKELREKKKHLL